MKKLTILALVLLSYAQMSCGEKEPQQLPKADKIVVKVVSVIQDPMVDGKRLHDTCVTPGYKFKWNDPWMLNEEYEKALEEISGGVIDYQIVDVIDSKDYFTFLRKSGRKLSEQDVLDLMFEKNWQTLKDEGSGFDYAEFVKHYGFDKMCDAGEIDEVWVWTFPMGGMWESNMLGDGAFWINSKPTVPSTCNRKLAVMGLNYERDLACAIESYGHRTESVMMQVYGWWDYDKKQSEEELTNWELYCAYEKYYGKYHPGYGQIGNIHFPPNGRQDYDWKNTDSVYTYADSWAYYPNLEMKNPRKINCEEWGSTHLGYMKWWLSHLPNFSGVNPRDGKLNNWWHYVVKYDEALELEKELNRTK